MPERINVADFDLASTLMCGQAFRWSAGADGWFTGIVGHEGWRLKQSGNVLEWETTSPQLGIPAVRRRSPDRAVLFDRTVSAFGTNQKTFGRAACGVRRPSHNPGPCDKLMAPSKVEGLRVEGARPTNGNCTVPAESQRDDPSKLAHYLGLDASLLDIVATFPDVDALQQAVRQHWGLRVLRQEPWETLASFIASSTKQIVQIRQIVDHLSRRFGHPLTGNAFSFPDAATLAQATLPQLRACKLGFRAEYLLAAARLIDRGKLRLEALPAMEYERALEELTKIHGVGEKIANCTLLFSCGFDQAFPIDVWMQRALHRLGWRGKKITRSAVLKHFGPYAGWAQQYLFYNERSRNSGTGVPPV